MTIRIAFPIHMQPWGTATHGIGRYMADLAQAVHRFGADHDVALSVFQDSYRAFHGFEGLPIRRFPSLPDRLRIPSHTTERKVAASARERLTWGDDDSPSLSHRLMNRVRDRRRERFLERSDISLVHYGFHLGRPLSPRNAPLVVTMHDLVPHLLPETTTADVAFGWRTILRHLKSVDHFIAISRTTAADLERCLGIPKERITTSYLGVDPKFRPLADPVTTKATLAREYGIASPYVLHVSAVEPRKNQIMIAKALCELPSEVQYVIVGGAGWRSQALHQTIRDFDLQRRVIFTGFVPDEHLPLLYGCAAVFVYPSLYEGFGFPILEAMSCACPVLSSNRGSLPEVCGDAAWMLPPDDRKAWGEALRRVIYHQEDREPLVKRGLDWVQRYTWKRCAEETMETYRQVVERWRSERGRS